MLLSSSCIVLCAFLASPPGAEFFAARPVWAPGRESEKNLTLGFRAVLDAPGNGPVTLRLAASTLYRAFVNGEFIAHGPARAAHGFYRVDEWDLTPHLKPGENVLAVEVAGYNANSYYVLDQPAFLQAEVVAGTQVLAATNADAAGFDACIVEERLQKVQRYSFQRPFIEVYRLGPGADRWRVDSEHPMQSVALAETEPKALLPRGVPYPRFDVLAPVAHTACGALERLDPAPKFWKDRSLTGVGPKLGGYPESELDVVPSIEMQQYRNKALHAIDAPYLSERPLPLSAMDFHILDFGRNLSGFLRCRVSCAVPTRLYVLFDEMLLDNDVNFRRLGTVSVLTYDLVAGDYGLESFEPYTLRYAKFVVLEGACEIDHVGLRTYENPDSARAYFACSDPRLNRIFEAARATFAQNAVDVFMDCPSRERAGWLCDSYFTAESALVLCGDTKVERNFLENFALPERFAHLPDGMLPMCYPSDHYDGVFIPNWALWCVVQAAAYLDRSGDRATIDALRPKVLGLFDYFKRFENEDGLLEKLESWVFVEWSRANDFTQDVNYPSNMLYAAALAAAARLYDLPELESKAARLRDTLRAHAFDGAFFVDNAVRKDGVLRRTDNKSEVCQYFALFFDVASPESHPELWRVLRDEFGPNRKETKAHPDVHFANMFVGNILRLELLSRYGAHRRLVEELCGYFYHMAEITGTLWENDGDYASLNHGFA
ncbi:MAG TPA: hypothetical protein PKI11_13430, partial [Candidatus Hydrogenedentes bacterium]|nr:hypothetical protein [Candidatus Hydrogenedentota bacterium]